MASIVQILHKKVNLNAPKFVITETQYETIMGSTAYGVSSPEKHSDIDVYGFCIPSKEIIFPHIQDGYVDVLSKKQSFNNFQQHHIFDHELNKQYDIDIYNIVNYFMLCMDGNPNMIDSLFTSQRCVLHCTQIGVHARENRKKFLSKKCWHTFKGYAYSQLQKMRTKHEAGKILYDIESKLGQLSDININEIELINYYDQILNENKITTIPESTKDKNHIIKLFSNTLSNIGHLLELNEKYNNTIFIRTQIDSLFNTIKTQLNELNKEQPVNINTQDIIISKITEKYPELMKGMITTFNKNMIITYLDKLKEFNSTITERAIRVRKYGYDTKFGYHVIRLIGEVQQILEENDLDLERSDRREQMKAIRAGAWSLDKIFEYFNDNEKRLEETYQKSKLQYSVSIKEIEQLLKECLEMKFGDLKDIIATRKDNELILLDLKKLIGKYEI